MTRVCLVGPDDTNLRYELLSRETAREALSTYDLDEPFENAVGIETVSLGAAVALLNDLEWYLVRFADEAMVLEPSVDGSEWLSRDLAAAIRDGDVDPETSGRYCKVYGLEPTGESDDVTTDGEDDGAADGSGGDATTGNTAGTPEAGASTSPRESGTGDDGSEPTDATGDVRYRLVEPMYVTRTGDGLPAYDLRDVEATLVERVTESEFGA